MAKQRDKSTEVAIKNRETTFGFPSAIEVLSEACAASMCGPYYSV